MKSILLGFILSLTTLQLFSQTEYSEVLDVNSKAKTSEEYFIQGDQNKIKEGKYLFKYKGKIQIRGQYQNNNKIGKWTYTPSPKLMITGNYKNNKKDGEWIYSQNKTIISVLKYFNGLLDGKQIGYYADGTIASELNYNMGKKDGVEMCYFQNGEIKETTHYENGLIHGENIRYSEEGEIIFKLDYFKDTPISLDIESADSNYSGQLKDGNGVLESIKSNTDKKQILLVRNVKDSLLHGQIIGYNYSGTRIFEGQYQNGNMIGKWNFYNSAGALDHSKQYESSQELKVDSTEDLTLNHNERFIIIEDMPKFEGNDQKLFQNFISRVVRYPDSCITNGIKGKVYVSFIINTEGKIADIKIDKSVHPLLDQESLNVIKSSPLWTPGFRSKIPVTTSFTVPINFNFM